VRLFIEVLHAGRVDLFFGEVSLGYPCLVLESYSLVCSLLDFVVWMKTMEPVNLDLELRLDSSSLLRLIPHNKCDTVKRLNRVKMH